MMQKPPKLENINEIHFTGIKGVGMTSLACCAQDLGIKITGTDVEEKFVTDQVLEKRGIIWQVGFSAENIKNPDLVITTGAHGGLNNPEVKAAAEKGIKVATHAQALGMFAEGKQIISVCGVGGKTTTCSMAATLLDFLGYAPSFAIGVGQLYPLGDPGRFTDGDFFIAEADEYAVSPGIDNRPRFTFLTPKIVVATNVELDHPDIYPDINKTRAVFEEFFKRLPKDGLLIACVDNSNIAQLVKERFDVAVQTYGFSPQADWQIENVKFSSGKTFFDLTFRGISFKNIVLSVPGRFNALNATAAFAVANFLGANTRQILTGLRKFKGTRRRFELIYESDKVRLYDDYAHHPTEIEATLKAAREWFPQAVLVAIFQPHTFSRTQALLEEFGRSFNRADQVIITDIYSSAREKAMPGFNSQKLVEEIKKFKRKVYYCPGKKEVIKKLSQTLTGRGEIVMTLGAGDIFLWHDEIRKMLEDLKKT